VVNGKYSPGHVSSVGVPSAAYVRPSWSISLLPGRKGFRNMSSAKTQPTAHKSTPGPYTLEPSKSSGARYHRAKTWCVNFRLGEPKTRARPKSASFKAPLGAISKLLGFKSRCNTQLAWQYATAFSVIWR
jgi:hypothetical protein